LGEDLAGELVHARGGGGAGRVGQCCVLGRAVRLGSHSPPRCVNATVYEDLSNDSESLISELHRFE
jgi:hypothetical protein